MTQRSRATLILVAMGAAVLVVTRLLLGVALADGAPEPAPAYEPGSPIEPGPVVAPPVGAPTEDPASLLRSTYDAITQGQWWLAAGAALSLVVLGLRRYGRFLPDWFRTDRGGVVLVVATALIGGLGHALAAGVPLSLSLVESALTVAIASVGGYTALRRALWPKDAAGTIGGAS